MKTKKTEEKRQEPTAALFEGFRALECLIPKSGLVPRELVEDVLGSISLGLQAVGHGGGDARIDDLAYACGKQMPADIARGLVSLARWIGGDRSTVGGSEEVAS